MNRFCLDLSLSITKVPPPSFWRFFLFLLEIAYLIKVSCIDNKKKFLNLGFFERMRSRGWTVSFEKFYFKDSGDNFFSSKTWQFGQQKQNITKFTLLNNICNSTICSRDPLSNLSESLLNREWLLYRICNFSQILSNIRISRSNLFRSWIDENGFTGILRHRPSSWVLEIPLSWWKHLWQEFKKIK